MKATALTNSKGKSKAITQTRFPLSSSLTQWPFFRTRTHLTTPTTIMAAITASRITAAITRTHTTTATGGERLNIADQLIPQHVILKKLWSNMLVRFGKAKSFFNKENFNFKLQNEV